MILHFNGKEYDHTAVIAQAKQGFQAHFAVKDLDVSLAIPDVLSKVVYQFNGKHYLLVGSIQPDAETIKVQVISKHLLKKCEILPEPVQPPARQYQAPVYQDRSYSRRY